MSHNFEIIVWFVLAFFVSFQKYFLLLLNKAILISVANIKLG